MGDVQAKSVPPTGIDNNYYALYQPSKGELPEEIRKKEVAHDLQARIRKGDVTVPADLRNSKKIGVTKGKYGHISFISDGKYYDTVKTSTGKTFIYEGTSME